MAHQLKATLRVAEAALELHDGTCADAPADGEPCEECLGCLTDAALALVRHELTAFGQYHHQIRGSDGVSREQALADAGAKVRDAVSSDSGTEGGL